MKKLILVLVFFYTIQIQSQDINFLTGQTWAVQEYYALHEESGERTDLYNFYSDNNLDSKFDGFEYDFQSSGSVTVTLDAIVENKTWFFFATGDSLNINAATYKLINLTNDEFVVRNSTQKYGIAFNYYLKLAPSATLSNEKSNFSKYIEVFPNPASDILNLKFDNLVLTNLKEIVILNALGKYVLANPLDNSNMQQVSTRDLSNGIYFLKIIDKSNTAIIVKKFIINK